MKRLPALLAIALLAAVGALAAVLFGERAEKSAASAQFSSFSDGPLGTRVAYLTLERMGFRVDRHTEEPAALAGSGVAVLFLIEPERPPTGDAVEALLRFVHEGGCLVLAAGGSTELHAKLGVVAACAPVVQGTVPLTTVVPAIPSAYSLGVTSLEPEVHPNALELRNETAVPIFRRTDCDGIEAAVVRLGQGRAIVFAHASAFANRAIGNADNAQALAAIAAAHAKSGRIAFDEYHHGFAAGRGFLGYLGRQGLIPAVLQALAALAVLSLALGGLRARPPSLEGEAPPEAREQVRALAEIYAKAHLRRFCAEKLEGSLRRDLENALGPGADVPELLRRRGMSGYRGLEALTRRRARIEAYSKIGKEPPEVELLAFARELARFEAECRATLGKRFGETT